MRTEIPKMSHEERQAGVHAKREVVLQFLASGEVYTSVVVAAKLMVVSTIAAERTLAARKMRIFASVKQSLAHGGNAQDAGACPRYTGEQDRCGGCCAARGLWRV